MWLYPFNLNSTSVLLHTQNKRKNPVQHLVETSNSVQPIGKGNVILFCLMISSFVNVPIEVPCSWWEQYSESQMITFYESHIETLHNPQGFYQLLNFFNQYGKMNQIILTSVHKQFGFQGFLTQENPKKPEKQKKTLKHGNLETHVCFSGNLPAGSHQVKPR